MNSPSIRFPLSSVNQWRAERRKDHDRRAYLRIGQDFHQHFKLHQVTGADADWCDWLYNQDGHIADAAIDSVIDWNN